MLQRHSSKSSGYPAFSEGAEGVRVRLKVDPRSSGNRLSDLSAQTIRVKLTAPPVEGEANKALIALMARACRITKSDVEIVSGIRSRHKTILIRGLGLDVIVDRLSRLSSRKAK